MSYCVWVSRSEDFGDLLDSYNDALSYHGLTWEQAMTLFELSLREGFLLVLCREEQKEEGDNAAPETC